MLLQGTAKEAPRRRNIVPLAQAADRVLRLVTTARRTGIRKLDVKDARTQEVCQSILYTGIQGIELTMSSFTLYLRNETTPVCGLRVLQL